MNKMARRCVTAVMIAVALMGASPPEKPVEGPKALDLDELSSRIKSVAEFQGSVTGVRVFGEAIDGEPKGRLVQFIYTSGVLSYQFHLRKNNAISFSGLGDTEVRLNEHTYVQGVDRVLLARDARFTDERGVGRCEVSIDSKQMFSMRCEAVTPKGTVEARFYGALTEQAIERR